MHLRKGNLKVQLGYHLRLKKKSTMNLYDEALAPYAESCGATVASAYDNHHEIQRWEGGKRDPLFVFLFHSDDMALSPA